MMISNHYPMTFGHEWNVVIVAVVLLLGIVIRHWFNLRESGVHGPKIWWQWPVAGALTAFMIAFGAWRPNAMEVADPVFTPEALAIAQLHCASCHADIPANDSRNLLAEARSAMLLQRAAHGAGAMAAREALETATLGGVKALGRDDLGALAHGRRADAAICDLRGVQTAGAWDKVAALTLCGPRRARDLVVEGRVVVAEGRIATLDLPMALERHRRLARRLAG